MDCARPLEWGRGDEWLRAAQIVKIEQEQLLYEIHESKVAAEAKCVLPHVRESTPPLLEFETLSSVDTEIMTRIVVGRKRVQALSRFKTRFADVPAWQRVVQTLSHNEINVLGDMMVKRRFPSTTVGGSFYNNGDERQRVLAQIFCHLDVRDFMFLLSSVAPLCPSENAGVHFRRILGKTRGSLHAVYRVKPPQQAHAVYRGKAVVAKTSKKGKALLT